MIIQWTVPEWFEQVQAQAGLEGLEFHTAPFSLRSTQRVAAREFLFDTWPDEFSSHSDVLNLEKRPTAKAMTFSISHCPLEVGVLASPDGIEIGLDIEVIERVTEKTVARVSDETETREMPSPAHLWAAKESFYKSVDPARQPTAIFDIRIDRWKKISPKLWSFDGRLRKSDVKNESAPGNGYGFVYLESPRIYAFAFQE